MEFFSPEHISKLYHTKDPHTSQKAVSDFDSSGGRDKHLRIAWRMVHKYPGCTAFELCNKPDCVLDEMQLRRRLADLSLKGIIHQGESRKCSIKKTLMCTWHTELPLLPQVSKPKTSQSNNNAKYEELAMIIKMQKHVTSKHSFESFINWIVPVLRKSDNKFNADLFRKNCGIETQDTFF